MLNVKDLKVYFGEGEKAVKAVDGLSLDIQEGEIVGLVGESGCGKTVTSFSLLRLLPSTATVSGEIVWNGKNIIGMNNKELRNLRGSEISMIFQNPVASLNPVYTVGKQVMDVLRLHRKLSKEEARKEAINLFKLVNIPDPHSRIDDYPHQFSGGMCQRIMISMAIAARPKLLIADEPTASLDVTIQAQIIELLRDLKTELGMSILMISHDLGVIANMCDRIAIMYLGRIVEIGSADDVFKRPAHPYTRALLDSIPVPDPDKKELQVLTGDIPSPIDLPRGCRFESRCKYRTEKCSTAYPEYTDIGKGHLAACFNL